MKIVAIMGSPRGMKGNTGRLLQSLLDGAEAAGAQTEVHSITRLTVKPCVACDTCHRTGRCAINDDFQMLWESMTAADAIVLASPNYIVSVTAQLKALLDRCCGPLHLSALEGRYAAAVVTAGGGGCDEVAAYMLSFMTNMGCWSVGSATADAWELVNEELATPRLRASRELGAQIVAAVEARQAMPEQETTRNAFRDRMKQLIGAMGEHWPYEYEYFKSRGWV